MEAEALNTILKLKEENIILKRAFDECGALLSSGRLPISAYGIQEADWFMRLLAKHLSAKTPCAWNKPSPETEAKLKAELDKIGIPNIPASNHSNNSIKTSSRVKWDKSLENDLNNDCNNCEYRRYNR